MRKITFLVVLALAAFGMSAQTNLVKNPSFESGFENWAKGPINSYTEPTVETGGAKDGNKYVQYKTTATTGFFQEVDITAGKKYLLTISYKATGDGTDARIWSNFKDANNGLVYLTTNAADDPLRTNNGYLPPAEAWSDHTVEFTAPANAVKFQFAVRAYSNSVVAFDNFSLVESGTAPPVLTVNPTSLTFSAAVSATSSAQTVTVSGTNLAAAPTVSITGADAAQFAQSGTLTAAGGELSVTFTPTTAGEKTAVLTVTSGEKTAEVALSGVGTTADNPYDLDDSAPLNALNEPFGSGVAAASLPDGWKSHSAQGNRVWETKAYNGNSYAQMTSFQGAGVYQTLLISPALNFDEIDKANVRFDWNSGYANGAVLKVYVMSKAGEKTEVKSINDNTNSGGYGTGFTTETLDLSAHSGVKFLVFEYNGEAGVTTTTYQVDNVIADLRSGIFTPAFEALSVGVANGKISFHASAGERITVYSVAGQQIHAGTAAEGLNEIAAPLRGIALVRVGARLAKVVL